MRLRARHPLSREPCAAQAPIGLRMADAIEQMHAVTIARIQGYAVGGGVVLAAVCDLRVAAEDAVFFIPEVDLGLPLAWGGIPRLVREIGPALTKDLVMTCRRFSPAEATAAGSPALSSHPRCLFQSAPPHGGRRDPARSTWR